MAVNSFEVRVTLDNGVVSTFPIDNKDLCAVMGQAQEDVLNLGEALGLFALVGITECRSSTAEAHRRCHEQRPAAPNVFETPRGETITLPGNLTKSDFVQLMELAATMLEDPTFQSQRRQGTVFLLRTLMKST